MGVDVHLFATVLFITSVAFAQQDSNICSYMIAIPREPKPDDFPVVDEGVTWSERPLFPGPERDELCMNTYTPGSTTMGSQVIYMEEEIEGDVVIARFNYDGDIEPTIDRTFISGTAALLGAVVRRLDDGHWYLIITQRQDYESPGMQLYVFFVEVDGEPLRVVTSVEIVNIDDNRPMIQVFEACQTPELGDPRLTECVYDVSDLDGEISTRFMRFEIDSDRNDDEIFYIQGSNIPGDWSNMRMTVGIRTPLNFEENALHIFGVTAYDSLPNSHRVSLMVQVQNVEHRPPRWVEIFAVQQFDEKTYMSFTVRAIDGDTGINRPIFYRIVTAEEDTFFRIETIEGGRDGAILHVDPIDRDTLEREVFQLTIVAYKEDDDGNESYSLEAPVVIIVVDINDNKPEPWHPTYHIAIEEETAMTLNLEEFGFHDRDLGQNAQYEVSIESVSPPGAHNAFYIAPLVGYQRQSFIIGTTNHHMLDYEVPEFQNIVLKVVAVDMDNTAFVGEAMLYIDLINWNDELPMFDAESRTVSFKETEGEGFFVANVRAADRDIDDRVVHSLMGNVVDFLRIDEDTGDIFVNVDNAFDYHRQNVIFAQVRADDTLGEPLIVNTAITQLVIQLQDINNTPPTLRLPRGTFSTEENVPEGYLITDEITATDPDTTARLEFMIDWENSYATKQGRGTDVNEYHECVEIITEYYPDENHKGAARGRILVKEIRPDITIDFEMFEVLYLSIRVYDRETVIGEDYDESMFTITIIDLNDNPPVWEEGTLDQVFSVRERSASGVVIGSVLATDIDGPQYNQVRYTIFPREDTPPDLVTIHFYTGQITVNTANAIDADEPKRWHLYYMIIASDCCYAEDQSTCPPDSNCHNVAGEITINIIDTNNKVPQPDYEHELFKTTVYLLESASNEEAVSYIVGTDLDRDELYHKVGYMINYALNPRVLQFFAVEQESGLIYVNYPEGSTEVLDRDRGEPTHDIFFNLYDNFHRDGDGFRNQYEGEVLITVVLIDVNDNAPELPDPDTISWSISENYAAGTYFLPILHAPDIDEPNTPNSLVGFEVLSLTPHRDIEVPDKMIDIRSVDTDKGELFTVVALRGYWGTYDMHIWAYDHGDPQQDSEEVYQLVIRPWNYHEPVFVFPVQDTVIRLSREIALVQSFLQTLDGNLLQHIHATDEDGGAAGEVTFSVVGNDEAIEYFDITSAGNNYGTLTLRRNDFADEMIKEFQVTIEATDGGTEPHSLSSQTTFRAVFVPTTGDPIFETNTFTVAFIEQEEGLTERHSLPIATDLKNHLCGPSDCYDIFYRITDGNSEGYFGLDTSNNILFLQRELNRAESAVHTLTIAASNSMEPTTPIIGSTLTITVNVREANPRPIFTRDIYTAGISTLDTIYRDLLTVQAIHTDGLPVTYAKNMSSMTADSSLEAVADTAFNLDPQTGVLTLNFQPTSSMHGMFDFEVVASDPAGGYDTSDVRVYLISTVNRVTFIFVNSLQKVEESADFIAQTFSTGFQMTCNIDQVVPATDAQGILNYNLTEVRSHFIRDDTPVLADEIELLRSDTVLLRQIQTTLNTELLVLDDFFTDLSPEIGTDSSLVTIYVLGALAALLALLCLILLVTFIVRTRIVSDSILFYVGFTSGFTRRDHTEEGISTVALRLFSYQKSYSRMNTLAYVVLLMEALPMLNRRLEALSMTKYGSLDSGINRVGIAAPGTNKHAVEGSNPVWNEVLKAPDFDAISDVSYDSDLIGIEDLPQFRNNFFPPGDSNSLQDIMSDDEPVATHSNNFGFNSSPFTPEFANSPFRRV